MLMIRFPVSWNLNLQIWHFEKIGRGLSASGGLIQKIYEVDPLTCPKCQGSMRVIVFIEHEDVIKNILQRRTSPQAFGLVGGEAEAVSSSQRAALDSGFISNSLC
jgi:hypothetical protein